MPEAILPPEIAALARALDEVTDEYDKNNRIIFASEAQRAHEHFTGTNRGLKRWSKSQQCIVPSCNKRSIVRSHTVPKGMSLSSICEDGHVLEPYFEQKIGTVKLRRTGISNATTFPGFCNDHELLFEEFENKKRIDTAPHVYLQTYRAACREAVRLDFAIEQSDWTVAEYCKSRDAGLRRLILERVRQQMPIDETGWKSLKIEDDQVLEEAENTIAPVRALARHVKNDLLPALERAVFQGDASGIHVVAQSLDMEIPVALAGSGPFFVNDGKGGDDNETFLLMNVVPSTGNTLVIFAGLSSNSTAIEAYQKRWDNHVLTFLSMIESWMINGTDQWWVKPSIWDALPQDRQLKLIDLMIDCGQNIGDECELSIFDDIRKDLLQMSRVAHAQNPTKDDEEFIATQQGKMA